MLVNDSTDPPVGHPHGTCRLNPLSLHTFLGSLTQVAEQQADQVATLNGCQSQGGPGGQAAVGEEPKGDS